MTIATLGRISGNARGSSVRRSDGGLAWRACRCSNGARFFRRSLATPNSAMLQRGYNILHATVFRLADVDGRAGWLDILPDYRRIDLHAACEFDRSPAVVGDRFQSCRHFAPCLGRGRVSGVSQAMSIGRSFIKGPRFAFRAIDVAAGGACERCVFNRGAHICADACSICEGVGIIDVTMVDAGDPHDRECSHCGGTGRVEPAAETSTAGTASRDDSRLS